MFKMFIEIWLTVGLFANAALFVPQAWALYKAKDPKGLSLLTFGGFNLIQLPVLLHGYLEKDYILFWGYVLSFITCGAVTTLIFWYKYKNKKNQKKKVHQSAANK